MKMSRAATKEYILLMRKRYGVMETKRAKGKVLDEFCETTGLERKHAIKVLRSTAEPLRPAGRKPIYDGATEALREIWLLFDQPCSKLLHPVLESYVESYEIHRGSIDARSRELLLAMSPSTIDRLLRPYRVRTSLWRGRGGPMNAMKREVAIRSEQWAGRDPGWFEADSVAHCGGSMAGSFVYTLTFTDTDSQWTELRAVWNRGGFATTIRIKEIEKALPFAIKGVNTDNGGEFLNWHLIRHLRERGTPVTQTRSRPYHKNDNARVEQKNGSHVRPLLGYDRFDDPDCVEALNELLILHSYWTNLFRPCMKLVSKVKDGHRYRKKYDQPRTPAQRILASPHVSKDVRERVKGLMGQYDCYTLKCLVQEKLEVFFTRFVDRVPEGTTIPVAAPASSALQAAPSGTEARPATGTQLYNRREKIPA
jgi:transposase InsO family protein